MGGHQNGHEICNINIFIESHTIAKLGGIIIKWGKKDFEWSENYNNMNVCNVLTLQNLLINTPQIQKMYKEKRKMKRINLQDVKLTQ
jgi:hypothetical protein